MTRGNNKAINVKIPTTRVIKALEDRLVIIKADYKMQDEYKAKYEQAKQKWQKEVAKWAIDRIANAKNFCTNYRGWNKTLNVDFELICDETDFPKEPEKDFEEINCHSYNDMVDEIENAIRILKLTDDEVVSTSTYNSIAKYL